MSEIYSQVTSGATRKNETWEQGGDCQGREQEIAVINRMAKEGLSGKTIKTTVRASFMIKINIGSNLNIHLQRIS